MKKGFTLIELLVVVLIIGILSAIALPQYEKAVTKAKITEMKVIAHSLYEAGEAYRLETGEYPADTSGLVLNFGQDVMNKYNISCLAPENATFRSCQVNLRTYKKDDIMGVMYSWIGVYTATDQSYQLRRATAANETTPWGFTAKDCVPYGGHLVNTPSGNGCVLN